MAMRADKAEVSWDTSKSKWLVRIQSGDEVMRRHCDVPKSASDQQLRAPPPEKYPRLAIV